MIYHYYIKNYKYFFSDVSIAKPKSSRNSSIKAFVVCLNFSLSKDCIPRMGSNFESLQITNFKANNMVKEHLCGSNLYTIKFVSCGDLSGFDSDASYALLLNSKNIAYWNGFAGINNHDGYNVDMMSNIAYMNSYTNSITYAHRSVRSGNNVGISINGGENCTIINNIAVIDASSSSWVGKALSIIDITDILKVSSNILYRYRNASFIQEDDLDGIEQNTIEYDPMFDRYLTYTDAGIDNDETYINTHSNRDTDMTIKSIGRNEIKADELGLITDCLEFLMDIECICDWSSSNALTSNGQVNNNSNSVKVHGSKFGYGKADTVQTHQLQGSTDLSNTGISPAPRSSNDTSLARTRIAGQSISKTYKEGYYKIVSLIFADDSDTGDGNIIIIHAQVYHTGGPEFEVPNG